LPSVGDRFVRRSTTHYSRCSNVVRVVDAMRQTIESDYDRANRRTLRRMKRADGSIEEIRTWRYDRTGNPIEVTDRHGTTLYEYDQLDRTTKETRRTHGEDAYAVESFFDAQGNRTKVVFPGGRTLISKFDRKHRLVEIDDGGRRTTYTYDENGNRQSCTTPNQVRTTYGYDALNRVESISSKAGAAIVFEAAFTYDLVGNRRSVTERLGSGGSRVVDYEYDEQYRLTKESSGTRSVAYAFDTAGNRKTMTTTDSGAVRTVQYTYDALNRLLSTTGGGPDVTYSYDINGNLIEKTVGTVKTSYQWDVANRLLAVDVGSDGSPDFEAQYDDRTRRIVTKEGGVTTYFRYDGGVSCQELRDGTVDVELVRGTGMGGGIGSILYRLPKTGGEETFAYNAVGHTVALTDAQGSVVSTNVYDGFGALLTATGSSSNQYLANTKERSTVAKLDNHGYRYYDPEIGRYISRDPLGHGQGLNDYLYVRNNPVNHVDPLGLGWLDWVQTGLDAASMIPGLGTATSLVNAGISAARGNWAEAGLNLVAAIPGVGTAIKGGKFVTKAVVAATKAARAVDKANDIKEKVEMAADMAKAVQSGDVATIAQAVGEAGVGRALDRRGGGGPGGRSRSSEGGTGGGSRAATQGTGCPPGKEGCFVTGTPVLLASGAQRQIERIEIGTLVHVDPNLSDQAPSVLRSKNVVQLDLVPLERDDREFLLVLLRDREWLDANAKSDQLYVELDELGISGWTRISRVAAMQTDDPEREGRVTATMARKTKEIVFDAELETGERIQVTSAHPFWIPSRQRWVQARELERGDQLLDASGEPVSVASLSSQIAEVWVYNIEVDVAHHYFVSPEGVAVHNYPPPKDDMDWVDDVQHPRAARRNEPDSAERAARQDALGDEDLDVRTRAPNDDPARTRPYRRKATDEHLDQITPKDAQGNFRDVEDPSIVLGKKDAGHKGYHKWSRQRDQAREDNASRGEVRDRYNEKETWKGWEDPSANRSGQRDRPWNDD